MTKEQTDILPDMSSEIASMGRGSMARRIAELEQELKTYQDHAEEGWNLANKRTRQWKSTEAALDEAKEALAGIAADDNTWQGQEAKAALVLIAHMLGGK